MLQSIGYFSIHLGANDNSQTISTRATGNITVAHTYTVFVYTEAQQKLYVHATRLQVDVHKLEELSF